MSVMCLISLMMLLLLLWLAPGSLKLSKRVSEMSATLELLAAAAVCVRRQSTAT